MKKKSEPQKTKWSIPQLEKHIRSVAKDTHRIVFTEHALKRMRQRKITNDVVLSTLRAGRIKRQPEPNVMKGSLECRMDHFVAGQDIGIIVAISDDDPNLVIVTAM